MRSFRKAVADRVLKFKRCHCSAAGIAGFNYGWNGICSGLSQTMRMTIDENWSSEEAPEDQGIHSTSDILHVAPDLSRISEMWNSSKLALNLTYQNSQLYAGKPGQETAAEISPEQKPTVDLDPWNFVLYSVYEVYRGNKENPNSKADRNPTIASARIARAFQIPNPQGQHTPAPEPQKRCQASTSMPTEPRSAILLGLLIYWNCQIGQEYFGGLDR